MVADNRQIGGTHYTDMTVQPWDAMRAWMTPDQFCGYLLGTAVAYLARVNVSAPGNGGIDDIEKARHVLAKLAECYVPPLRVCTVAEETLSPGIRAPTIDFGAYDGVEPAVSESAAGDVRSATIAEARAHKEAMRDQLDDPRQQQASNWPGPDWSQAPAQVETWEKVEIPTDDHYFWWGWKEMGITRMVKAPDFGYPGHWRDSLRKRPEGV